jgi:hypothetical protein
MPTRSPTLRLLQAMFVAVLRRDKAAALQGLRMLTTLTDDHEGEQILRLLSNNLDPAGRFWLGTLHGARVGLEDPALEGPAAGKLLAT